MCLIWRVKSFMLSVQDSLIQSKTTKSVRLTHIERNIFVTSRRSTGLRQNFQIFTLWETKISFPPELPIFLLFSSQKELKKPTFVLHSSYCRYFKPFLRHRPTGLYRCILNSKLNSCFPKFSLLKDNTPEVFDYIWL